MTSAWQEEELRRPFRRYLSKVPEVTVLFWIPQVLAMVAGLTFAHALMAVLGLGITTMLVATAAAVLVVVQLAGDRYVPWRYWLVVVAAGVLGALLAENLVDLFGVAPRVAAVVFVVLLVATLVVWYAVEKTLSIHTVVTPRREVFYWLAVLLAFAAGDAGGELLAWGWGIIALVVAVWSARRLAWVVFWAAYVLTGPLAAAVNSLLTQPLGDAATGAGCLIVVALVVVFLTVSRRDQPSLDAAARKASPR